MIDLTNIDTIYKKRFRTLSLRVEERFQKSISKAKSMKEPSDVYHAVLRGIYEKLDHDQEHFSVLFLNANNRVVGYKVVFTGSQNASVVDPKIIYRNAILFGAQQIVVAHNHPSASLSVSPEDRIITRQIARLGMIHNIKLLDHIILTYAAYKSLAFEEPELFDVSISI